MKFQLTLVLALGLTFTQPVGETWARGFGGGFRGGGGGFRGGGGFHGGGFSGGGFHGGNFGGGGFHGGNFGGGEFRGGAGSFNRGGFSGSHLSGDRFGGSGLSGLNRGGLSGNRTAGDRFGGLHGNSGLGGFSRDSFGDRFSGAAPSRSRLNSFLGLPSDGGLHNLNSSSANRFRSGDENNFNRNFNRNTTVNNFNRNGFNNISRADGSSIHHGTYVGPRGGVAHGGAITGPRGNTYFRGGAVGPHGGAVAGRGVVGQRGYAAGFAAVSPSGRYASARVVRGNFHGYGLYRTGWYTAHPGAWFAAGWATGAAWRAATWGSLGVWCDCDESQPVYYDYGNNVTYQDNSVYLNGEDIGTAQQYYDQAEALATAGSEADARSDGDWLPLGVFAMTEAGENNSNMTIQLAVNKAGIIRGNYTDTTSNETLQVQGSVDKKTQRAAWTIGNNKNTVIETGLYNLSKDEAPALVHFGSDRTEQWLLVRLKQDGQQSQLDK